MLYQRALLMHENESVVAKEMDEVKHAAEVRTEQNLARGSPLDLDLKEGRCPSLENFLAEASTTLAFGKSTLL
jgi:hypothetical protein